MTGNHCFSLYILIQVDSGRILYLRSPSLKEVVPGFVTKPMLAPLHRFRDTISWKIPIMLSRNLSHPPNNGFVTSLPTTPSAAFSLFYISLYQIHGLTHFRPPDPCNIDGSGGPVTTPRSLFGLKPFKLCQEARTDLGASRP